MAEALPIPLPLSSSSSRWTKTNNDPYNSRGGAEVILLGSGCNLSRNYSSPRHRLADSSDIFAPSRRGSACLSSATRVSYHPDCGRGRTNVSATFHTDASARRVSPSSLSLSRESNTCHFASSRAGDRTLRKTPENRFVGNTRSVPEFLSEVHFREQTFHPTNMNFRLSLGVRARALVCGMKFGETHAIACVFPAGVSASRRTRDTRTEQRERGSLRWIQSAIEVTRQQDAL